MTDRETDEVLAWNGCLIGRLSGPFTSFYCRLSDSSNLRDPPPSDLSARSGTVTGVVVVGGGGCSAMGDSDKDGRRVLSKLKSKQRRLSCVRCLQELKRGNREVRVGADRSASQHLEKQVIAYACSHVHIWLELRTAP